MLQSSTVDLPQLKLVSISVDPLHDTPEVLARYGRTFGADRERSVFLTGDPPDIDHVSRSRSNWVESTRLRCITRNSCWSIVRAVSEATTARVAAIRFRNWWPTRDGCSHDLNRSWTEKLGISRQSQ